MDSRQFQLVLHGPNGQDHRLVVGPGDTVTVGCVPDNNLVLDDEDVSAQHFSLSMAVDGSVEIRDLGSELGTWVNQKLLRPAMALHGGERVRVGSWNALASWVGGEAAQAPPTGVAASWTTAPVRPANPGPAAAFRSVALDLPKLPATGGDSDKQVIRETSRFEDLDNILKKIEDDTNALRALYRLLKQLNGVQAKDDVVRILAEAALATFDQATHVSIFLAHGTQVEDFRPVRTCTRGGLEEGTPVISRTLLRHVLGAREALIFNDQDKGLREAQSLMVTQLRSGLLVPLWDHKEIRGVVQVESRVFRGLFHRQDLELLAIMANQAALILSNLDMTTNLLALNEDLQRAGESLRATNQKLGAASTQLERDVDLRTQQLVKATEEALQARKTSDHANRAKSQFLANMSHELRTPMNAIIGYSEMLKEEAVDLGEDAVVDDLTRIHSSGRQLLELINGILDLSKLEAGKMDVHVEKFSLLALCNDVATQVRPAAEKNGNTLELQVDDAAGDIQADLPKTRTCLLNILSNAAKFTLKGRVVLHAFREGSQVLFTVEDTGIGIAPEHRARVFEPFSQAEAAATRRFGGTGLGLALSQRFARLMGGDVLVESTPGVGSTFTLWLPAVVASSAG